MSERQAQADMQATIQTGKEETYARLTREIVSVLEGESNNIARMATVSCLLHEAFPDRIWTGFYIVDPMKPEELVVGPYQGTLGCLRIPFGKGVCGTAAAERATQVVDDVHDFPGHIACDSRSVSEIVVPVCNCDGDLIAVLDIDSDKPAMFDQTDRTALEELIEAIFG
ncbi:GAF domain-containing protein [Parvularcula sp. IMCC14364]|uniref:GAF domain-containing protein n=1 Tax=Parvularcula sp. IMCC14364 TaxID=3067902 RepID=UPI0027408A25|nr:GAF domain-containing protein [Parvularcula sp. IMCC14364]